MWCGLFPNPSYNVSLSPLKGLRSLRVNTWPGDWKYKLREVANYCPSLQRVVLHARPWSTDACTGIRGQVLEFPDVSEKCPDLEQLLISRTEVVSRAKFSKLVLRHCGQIAENSNKIHSKILILKDTLCEARCGPVCLVTAFRCVCSQYASLIDWDNSETQDRLLGDAKVVQLWCEAFFQADHNGDQALSNGG